jgi:class 3 adenylate cyclase
VKTTIHSAWLETINGARLPLLDSCAIGRAPENGIVVAGDKVSRRHALIHRQNETEFWLVDLGSRNGTHRNGSRVKQPTQLRNGDRIDVGAVQFRFCVDQSQLGPPGAAVSSLAETIATRRASNVWLLVVDVHNFTGMSQSLPADELARKLGSWLLQCSDVVERSGGCVDKYVGDGFLAYWDGTGVTPEKFASALQDFTDLQGTSSLKFRWTLHHASVQLGISRFGNDSLVGKEINFAYRMEKIAGTLQLPRLLSKAAADSLRTILKVRDVGSHPVKGFPGEYQFLTL